MKRFVSFLFALVLLNLLSAAWISPDLASANDSPNWIATKPNSFSLQTSSDLNSRGTLTIRGVVPPKTAEYDEAIRKQQTSGGQARGFCTWTLKDAAYPGYAGKGGVGILVLGPQLSTDVINPDSFSMKGIRYTAFLSQGPTEYLPMWTDHHSLNKSAINLNGTDLLFASRYFRNMDDVDFSFKEFTASFSTNNWPGGNYQIVGVFNDGCSEVYTSTPVALNLSSIPTPVWKCDTPKSIKSNELSTINCSSDIAVNLLPFHLEIFQSGAWIDVSRGTANGKVITVRNLRLPIGNNSLRLRTDELTNKFKESISPEINIQVTPGPYSVKCSWPNAVRAGQFFQVSCLATNDIDGAFAHLQSLSNGKWTNIEDVEWSGTSVSFSNLSFSKTGTGTMRVVTDAQAGKYIGYTTSNFKIEVSAQKNSSSSGGSSSAGTKTPSGKVDKTSNAYKTMFNVGKNFAKVSMANDTAISQCGSALRTGMIRARGIPQYLGAQTQMIQSYMKTASGWRGCLDGFGH
jgi:hypothetical protein